VPTRLLVGLALVTAAPAPKPVPPAPAPPALAGEWAFKSMVEDGRAEECSGDVLAFAADGTFVARDDTGPQGAGTYTADATADPPEVDLDEAGTGVTVRGIWKVDGDTLTLCVRTDPKRGRPTAFAAPPGSDCVLVTLKRAKKE
jgi:uncharacterized protein (TIGR03067 family)